MRPMALFGDARAIPMKLLFKRDQRTSTFGKIVFTLDVRAEISAEEKARIEKYKLMNENLYVKNPLTEVEPGVKGLGKALIHHALNVTVSVKDLMQGKRIECKEIVEM